MEYGKIIAVTGMPGLYELLSSKNDGAIVRSLDDKSTKFVSSRVHNFSHLESIEVFTVRDNVNLSEIFHAMEGDAKVPDGKDAAALKKYFETIYPDLDFDRVYSSDLKKMVKWYSVLKEHKIEIKLSAPEPEAEIEEEVSAEVEKTPASKQPAKAKAKVSEEDAEDPKPKKAAPKKKAEAAKEDKTSDVKAEAKEAAPKKAAAKKKAEPASEEKAPAKKKAK